MGKNSKVEPAEENDDAEVEEPQKLVDLPMGEMEKKAAKMASEKVVPCREHEFCRRRQHQPPAIALATPRHHMERTQNLTSTN